MAEGLADLAEYAECKSGPAIACCCLLAASSICQHSFGGRESNKSNKSNWSTPVCWVLQSVGRHATDVTEHHTEGLDGATWKPRKGIVILCDTKLMTFENMLIQNPSEFVVFYIFSVFVTFLDWLFSWGYAAPTKNDLSTWLVLSWQPAQKKTSYEFIWYIVLKSKHSKLDSVLFCCSVLSCCSPICFPFRNVCWSSAPQVFLATIFHRPDLMASNMVFRIVANILNKNSRLHIHQVRIFFATLLNRAHRQVIPAAPASTEWRWWHAFARWLHATDTALCLV